MPQSIILASASPRRKELLRLLGLPFAVVPSEYEERLPSSHPDPPALAVRLATEKALQVARAQPHALVLGADTVVALGTQVYGKPADAADAARILGELSGKTHQVVTGVALVTAGPGTPEVRSFFSMTHVTFRELDLVEIAAYVGTQEPMDKAGAYAIQGCGALLIEGIHGDYPNVVGLPLAPLAAQLRSMGLRVLGLPPG
jgi:septum formation protein